MALSGLLFGCEQRNEPPVVNQRTVIVYMNADNNLYNMQIGSTNYGALRDVNEMELGWNDHDYRNTTLLVYLNSGTKDVPKIYRISHDEDMTTIRSKAVQSYTAHDSSRPEILSMVLRDAMQIAPAASYGLVLWSHGTGWVPMNMGQPLKSAPAGDIATYTFGSSETYAKNQMEIDDLARALPRGVVFDYIAFDACYMGCIEVAYELKDYCRKFIGSAIETPIDGFPYHKIMGELVSADAEGIVKKSYDHYKALSGWWATFAMSSVESSKLDALAAATKTMLANNPKALSQLSTSGVQDLSSSPQFRGTYWDLADFMGRNWASAGDDLTAFKNALNDAVVYKNFLPRNMDNYDILTYSGFSCYVPRTAQPKSLEAYRTRFAWSAASGMGALR